MQNKICAVLLSLLLSFSFSACSSEQVVKSIQIAQEVVSELDDQGFFDLPEEDVPTGISIEGGGLTFDDLKDVDFTAFGEDTTYIEINGNSPFAEGIETVLANYNQGYQYTAFEEYSDLDELGRPQTAVVLAGKDLLPTETREQLSYKPVGWHSVKYDIIPDKYLYNRCHLIAFMIAGENDNPKNLCTGTRWMNLAMIPFETEVKEYVKTQASDVYCLYRVSPVYNGDELLCRGLQMEAFSVSDQGKSVSYNIFIPNIQPEIGIDYLTGESWMYEWID